MGGNNGGGGEGMKRLVDNFDALGETRKKSRTVSEHF